MIDMSIARTLLVITKAGSDDVYRLAVDLKEDTDMHRSIGLAKLDLLEDMLFIQGQRSMDIKGISNTSTIRYDLLNAIKEFSPVAIITSSKYLNINGIEIIRSQFVPKYTHYLVPKLIPIDVAEFIVAEDIKFEAYNDAYIMYEWANVVVHNPDYFVKVTRRNLE